MQGSSAHLGYFNTPSPRVLAIISDDFFSQVYRHTLTGINCILDTGVVAVLLVAIISFRTLSNGRLVAGEARNKSEADCNSSKKLAEIITVSQGNCFSGLIVLNDRFSISSFSYNWSSNVFSVRTSAPQEIRFQTFSSSLSQ
jgi:hypothetical protein